MAHNTNIVAPHIGAWIKIDKATISILETVKDAPCIGVSRHFKAGNIPTWKAKRIAELLGYELKFDKK